MRLSPPAIYRGLFLIFFNWMWNENQEKQVNVTYKNVKDDRKFAFSFGLFANTGLLSDASIKCNQVGCLESIKISWQLQTTTFSFLLFLIVLTSLHWATHQLINVKPFLWTLFLMGLSGMPIGCSDFLLKRDGVNLMAIFAPWWLQSRNPYKKSLLI
jgi:hypothetical protein